MAETEDLTDEVKRFIVGELACFDTPSKVAAAVKEQFDVEVSRQRVHCYDPTKKAGADLSEALKLLFTETRKQFLDEMAQVPIASRSYRLRKLQTGVEAMERVNNHIGAAALMEQAAKEVGGAFTNKREMSGPNGGPIPLKRVHDFSDAELLAIAAAGREDESDHAATGGGGSAQAPDGAVGPGGLREHDRDTGQTG